MFAPEIYNFLNELKENNYREWFHENKPVYQSCRDNVMHNLEIIIHEIAQFDTSVAGTTAKDCVFRINRDVRFSKDKSPYKTHFGAFIAPGGRNNGTAGYYIHLEPDNSFLAGGIYMPPPPALKAIRQEIYENYEEFLEIVESPQFKDQFNAIEPNEKLKTKPKGFPVDFIGLEYLKFKHYTVLKNIDDQYFIKSEFLDEIRAVFKSLYPLNKFLNYAINH